MTNPSLFNSPSKGKLALQQVIDDISQYLKEEEAAKYRLVIGSDSHERQIKSVKLTNFITAIVVHRVDKGGRYYWRNGLVRQTHSLRDKLYQETTLSLNLAQELVPKLNESLVDSNWELEIHIDVGQTGETRLMIQEVVGMVIGSGYTAKTKPESYAASSVADKHT